MSDPRLDRLAAILERAEHVHGIVSESRNGVDPDWPLFYAWWLLEWSDLAAVLEATPSRSELVFELIRLDREFRSQPRTEAWSQFYAPRLVERRWAT